MTSVTGPPAAAAPPKPNDLQIRQERLDGLEVHYMAELKIMPHGPTVRITESCRGSNNTNQTHAGTLATGSVDYFVGGEPCGVHVFSCHI